jgi:hypothetical protein
MNIMAKIRIIAFFMALGAGAYAQKNHFIALQSENKQPFYAKIDTRVFNSSPAGHLIIPKLVDSNYRILIGFPKNAVPEQTFSIAITKDIGFILRIGKDKGLYLSNSQTAQTISPAISAPADFVLKDTFGTYSKKDDNFSKLMAQVVNDSGVMEKMNFDEPKKEVVRSDTGNNKSTQNPEIATVEPKKKVDTSQIKQITTIESKLKPIQNGDSSTIVRANKKKLDQQKKSSTIKTPEKKEGPKRSVVRKILEQRKDSVLALVYEDFIKEGQKDTINIFIPLDSNISSAQQAVALNDNAGHQEAGLAGDKKINETVSSSSGFKKDSATSDSIKSQVTEKTPLFRSVILSNNCKVSATDYDVDKLRIKILAIEDEDDKISSAKKIFKLKCFTTNQIKALSEVFDKDAGKYKLFDAAYSYVSDAANFNQLQSLLKDEYYINRFRAMIK